MSERTFFLKCITFETDHDWRSCFKTWEFGSRTRHVNNYFKRLKQKSVHSISNWIILKTLGLSRKPRKFFYIGTWKCRSYWWKRLSGEETRTNPEHKLGDQVRKISHLIIGGRESHLLHFPKRYHSLFSQTSSTKLISLEIMV